MKPHGLGRPFAFLVLAVLFLEACQLSAIETKNPPAEPTRTAAQLVTADTETPTSQPTKIITLAAPTPSASIGVWVPDGWQSFYNAYQGYSLAYPPEWGICNELQYSRAFCEFQQKPGGMGPPLRLYVSVYPQEYTDQDGQVINFTPLESIREFMALKVGESKLRVPDAMPPEAFTYTRLPDQTVAGQTALVIENSTVWEAPTGTKDRSVFIISQGTLYNLGMYYETPEQLAMFEQVLDSFRIAP
jgi:hypothetical protein